MRMQVQTPVFWVIYFSLLLFLLLLGETYLGLYVMGAITLFLFLFLPANSDEPNHPWYKISVGVAALLLVLIGISTLFSISLPVSHQAAFEWLFIVNLFFWFLEVRWDDINKRYWLLGMLLIGAVMMILGLVSFAFPQFSYLIPGMNLIYPTYGHNHLGVILIMLIPMFWAAAQEWPSPFTRALAIVFNFSPFITFGRTVILLASLQVFTVHRMMLRKHTLIWQLVRLLGLFMIILLAAKLYIGWYVDQTNHCPVPKYRNIVCKSWREERRYWYYKQAFEGLKEHAWVGSGPSTFGLISEKYSQLPSFTTSFVHNDFLQYFVELGLAGGILVCFALCWPLVALYRHSRLHGEHDPLFQGIYWGTVFVLLNSLFDYDLNFIGVMTIQVMSLAILSRWGEVQPWPKKLSFLDLLVAWWRKWFHSVATAVIVAICLVYAITNIMLDYGKTAEVLRYYPYFHWQSKILYEAQSDLSPELRSRFQQVYWHHSGLLHQANESSAATLEDVQRFTHIFVIDPWSRLSKEVYSYYLSQGQTRQAEYEILAANAFFAPKILAGFQRETIPDKTKVSLSHALMWLSDVQFQQGRYAEGIDSIVAAQRYVDWALNDSRYCGSFPTLYRDLGDDFATVVAPLATIPALFFGDCRSDYADLYLRIYREQVSSGTCDASCVTLLDRGLQLDPARTNYFWTELAPIHLHSIEQQLGAHQPVAAVEHWNTTISAFKTTTAARNLEFAGTMRGDTQIRQLLELTQMIEPQLSALEPEQQRVTRKTIAEDVRWLYSNLE